MYKLIKPLQESGKMSVTPEESEALQKALFEMGYTLYHGHYILRDSKTIYFYWQCFRLDDKIFKSIGIKHKKGQWNGLNTPLHKFEDYFEQ